MHVGILLMFVAFTGMAFRVDQEATLKPGESVEMQSPYGGTYKLTHLGVSQYNALNRVVSAATVQVDYDGKSLGVMKSEKRQHVDSFGRPTFEPSTEVGIRSDLREDLYIVYAGSVDGHGGGGLPLHHQPAGLVGLVRRHGARGRRHPDDVAGRRRDRRHAAHPGRLRSDAGRRGERLR